MAPIGVVIPAFGHSRFLAEAIKSACTQEIDCGVYVVVVDDGCRNIETAQTVQALMVQYPGVLHYLRQPNTRLPGARNTGVRFLLQLVPELEFIYFLDADNRLETYSLKAFRAAFGPDPKIGWSYPDIGFFGQVGNAQGYDVRETAPRYSPLVHLLGNISEAGSMVRAEAFHAGVFYDETMRHGFEDWEFWLAMLEAGYRGVRAADSGFSYRKRPESMLANSRRFEESLITYIRRKHAALYAPRQLLQMEHEEAPYFALWLADDDRVELFTDPLAAREVMDRQSFLSRLVTWAENPREYFFPEKIVVMTSRQAAQFGGTTHYLRWLFWHLRALGGGNARIGVEAANRLHFEGRAPTAALPENQFLCLGASEFRSLVRDGSNTVNPDFQIETDHYLVETPGVMLDGASDKDLQEIDRAALDIVEALKNPPLVRHHLHRRYAGPNLSQLRADLIEPICAVEGGVSFPMALHQKRLVLAFDQEILGSDVARNRLVHLSEMAVNAGFDLAFVQEFVGALNFTWFKEYSWAGQVSDVVPLPLRASANEYRMYLGRRVRARLPLSSKNSVSTFARLADIAIAVGDAGTAEVLGEIRTMGVDTVQWVDPCFYRDDEFDPFGKILAYEHSLNRVISDSTIMTTGLTAQGLPSEKINTLEQFVRFLQASSID